MTRLRVEAATEPPGMTRLRAEASIGRHLAAGWLPVDGQWIRPGATPEALTPAEQAALRRCTL